MQATIHDRLRDAYEAIHYVGRPNHYSHPDRLQAIAALYGLAVPPRASLSVLEIGCGDGSNLIPIAAAHPDGRFVGIDLSARLTASAREMADGLGLANVRLLEADLRQLPGELGAFDVVVAHGFYSWVPPDVRDAMFAAMLRHLAPQGIAYVSYNLLPGAWIRRIGWDAMHFHVRGEADHARRVANSRAIIDALVETWRAQPGPAAAMAAESFAQENERTDGGFAHDNLSQVNDPVYYSTFVQHAQRHGLAVIADADPATLSVGGASADFRARLENRSAVARDQMLDFVHVRTLRQSLLVPAAVAAGARLDPDRTKRLHYSAAMSFMQQRLAGSVAGGAAGDLLAEHFPASVPYEQLARALRSEGATAGGVGTRVLEICIEGVADLHLAPLPVVARPSARPRAIAIARWQATRRPFVANLRHAGVRLADDFARAILPLCDGARSRSQLLSAVRNAVPAAEAADPMAALERRLAQFASAALFEA